MSALATTQETIDYAKFSIGLCANYNSAGVLWGARLTPRSPVTIAIVTDALEWALDGGAVDTVDLRQMANYLTWLIGKFGMEAKYIISGGGGGVVVPPSGVTIVSPIKITGNDFVSATEWQGANSDGITIRSYYTLQVFYNDVQRFLNEGDEWERTSTGINILISGFDAITYPDVILYIYISP